MPSKNEWYLPKNATYFHPAYLLLLATFYPLGLRRMNKWMVINIAKLC